MLLTYVTAISKRILNSESGISEISSNTSEHRRSFQYTESGRPCMFEQAFVLLDDLIYSTLFFVFIFFYVNTFFRIIVFELLEPGDLDGEI